jgi:hypothetical protein
LRHNVIAPGLNAWGFADFSSGAAAVQAEGPIFSQNRPKKPLWAGGFQFDCCRFITVGFACD